MRSPDARLQEQIERLNRIGISLTLEHDLESLLSLIVSEARALVRADGGSLYLVQNGRLRFAVAQNESLQRRLGDRRVVADLFLQSEVEISSQSLAGYVASTGRILNIEDVYQIPPDRGYQFSARFDIQNHYRTQSVVLVPMNDRRGDVAGVLCLVNAMDEQGHVTAFSQGCEQLLVSIGSQAMAAIENARLIEKLKLAYLDTIFCLSMAAEERDRETGLHVRRISGYSGVLGEQLGLDPATVERLRYASPLHDVGKIGIPDSILQKPGKLTAEEYEVMKSHTMIGARILKGESEYLAMGREIAQTHHEKFDGTGYPQGRVGQDIPLCGRVVAVADAFDALVSQRVYKSSLDAEEAGRIICQDAGRHFCPDVVNAFRRTLRVILEVREQYRDDPLVEHAAASPGNGAPRH